MQMNLMDIIGPVALFVGVICIAAALYFVITLIKGASARRREQRDVASRGRPSPLGFSGWVPRRRRESPLTLLSHKR